MSNLDHEGNEYPHHFHIPRNCPLSTTKSKHAWHGLPRLGCAGALGLVPNTDAPERVPCPPCATGVAVPHDDGCPRERPPAPAEGESSTIRSLVRRLVDALPTPTS